MEKLQPHSPNLDVISENIIYLLSLDSRQSVSKLAKKLNINRKVVENRYNKLFNKGYIKYLTISNEKNRFCFTIFAKLSKIDANLIDRIKNIPGLLKLKETLGAYDISVLVDVNSQETMEKFIAKVSNMLHNNILTFDVVRHDIEDTPGYKSFCHNLNFLSEYKPLTQKSINLSKEQELVLRIIRKKCNFTYFDLQKQTKISYPKLKQIINFLVDNRVVRFSIDPDYEKLNLEFHNLLVKIKIGRKKEFEKYIINHPGIHWVKYSTGRWDYVLSVNARNINEFIDVAREIRAQNKDLILEETSLISKIKEMRRH